MAQHIEDLPRAVLYCWPTSALSIVPQLCLLEKGYTDDECVLEYVDISQGENFLPSYLRVTESATIPALVVPKVEGSSRSKIQEFHTLTDTISICQYIDDCRPPHLVPTGTRPPPILSPITLDDKAVSDALIHLIHLSTVDPNFLDLAARDESELGGKAMGSQGNMLHARRSALQVALNEYTDSSRGSTTSSSEINMIAFLEERANTNQTLLDIYNGDATDSQTLEFLRSSREAWTVHLPSTLAELEASMVGPFAIGDYLSIADCFIIAWLARIVQICGGALNSSGLVYIEPRIGGHRIGDRLQNYWGHWVQRTSFGKVFLS